MGRRSVIRAVLDEMTRPELQEFLDRQDLAVSGSKDELIERLVRHHDRDLEDLMTCGPWALTAWNDFAEEKFDCRRRNSYLALTEELTGQLSLDGSGSGDSTLTVADVRASPGDFAFLFEHPEAEQLIREASPQTTVDEIIDRIFRKKTSDARSNPRSDANGKSSDTSTDLTENEKFFLQFSNLRWPLTIGEATAAYRTGVLMLHPDRHAAAVADTANSTLRRFIDGFESLKSRL